MRGPSELTIRIWLASLDLWSREAIIATGCELDPNGVWTDEENEREFGGPADTAELRESLRAMLVESLK